MRFQERLKKDSRADLWKEYCGFLGLSIDDYMYIQNRLMEEQIQKWSASGLGKRFLGDKVPQTVDEFREAVPLTSYADYADVLLTRQEDMLPEKPSIWIQTTWEGGIRPVKLAPYTRAMLDKYRHHTVTTTMLASSRGKGHFSLAKGDRVLYGGAPLPYITGLIPEILEEDISLTWLPDTNANSALSFSQRIKKGFSMAMNGGVDFFFAIGSVANYITDNFSSVGGRSKRKISVSPGVALRYLKAKYISKRDDRPIYPGDVFDLKGFVITGTDGKCYREKLAKTWGVEPIEIASGTEATFLAAESWEHNGMVFFPDSCFYEFIDEEEMRRNLADPGYVPRTCLMNEVVPNRTYELVLSVFHGGAFMRYRIGDTYRCLSAGGKTEPPRFTFVDRVPNVIDIAGFTRITEGSINEVLRLSKLGIGSWLAKKEFKENGQPFLHMYLEILPEAQQSDAVTVQILTELLAAYFKYFDSDYSDLKKLLDMEPLEITILRYGTIDSYKAVTGRHVPAINPDRQDVADILRWQYSHR